MRNLTTRDSVRKEIIGLLLLAIFIISFLFMEDIKNDSVFEDLPSSFMHVNTVFLSILIEAVPFILLGVFVSALIQTFVTEQHIQKLIPENPYMGIGVVLFMGVIFPVCECAIIPVVRRLIKKGLPLHLGVVFLLTVPIVNPVVILSTFYAFRTNLTVVYGRIGLALLVAIVIGLIVYWVFRNQDQLRSQIQHGAHEHSHGLSMSRWKQTVYHASDEFFDTGKFLIFGAFLASMFQVFINRNDLLALGSSEWSSTGLMMGLAFLLSICSEADAFIAASFGSTFTVGSIIAFLVYGPMLDVKNMLMMFAYFKARFVFVLMGLITLIVFAASMVFQYI
ncbi:permease [Fictibacillus barbaricus]|uniref:Permease n=1 Tax=Fictibacillus barbaricus TaxID=182136 RepID=A0ABS2ZHZ2_9BACL|nr:permease [Fictibacillus barbaricus]MBN3546266.1 permease [Fictibacillus barbaricus]GGB39807.1 permease [Fictibacillus barbaricus]